MAALGRRQRRPAGRAGGGAGELGAPQAPRIGPGSTVWVADQANLELGSEGRVLVLDLEGRFERVFGRGAAGALPADSGQVHPGQAYRAFDLAFGPGDRVYLSCERPGENGEFEMVFRRF